MTHFPPTFTEWVLNDSEDMDDIYEVPENVIE